ncbi:VTC domain-containing protein [Candidatus Woesearchaeota archaeon]|nr:VTC domain-containing protein [Candidatus Woesearchaeota archaeon]
MVSNLLSDFLRLDTLPKRYELKFLLQYITYEEVCSIIRENPALFSEIYQARQVNNIYLDSPSLKNYEDNLIGYSQRLKVRIRWYGSFFGTIHKPVLELKIRTGQQMTKISYPLKPFQITPEFSFALLKKEVFPHSKLPAFIIELLHSLVPVLFNSYRRRYFLSADKHYRLTLDTDLSYSKAKKHGSHFLTFIKDPDSLVLELKYAPEYHAFADLITQHFPFRLTKNSKYVSGVSLLDF